MTIYVVNGYKGSEHMSQEFYQSYDDALNAAEYKKQAMKDHEFLVSPGKVILYV